MSNKFKLTNYRILGSFLVISGIIGYFTIADEFRHFGEFIGVSCVLVSGFVFLLIDLRLNIFQNIELQWISFCLLACIPFGVYVLDNMPIGISIGLILGITFAILLGKSNKTKSGN
ncbi:MAG: hypothetical protein IPH94_08475 [Saprospiraceae bacterium]|nr:hypothetical protein [Saprospiraceae bacterium]MBK8110798.1 hypothetical protein [Saprospiraceae bacterium]MBK9686425.1 hypothetical protein [Saprospiraceae bacterium]